MRNSNTYRTGPGSVRISLTPEYALNWGVTTQCRFSHAPGTKKGEQRGTVGRMCVCCEITECYTGESPAYCHSASLSHSAHSPPPSLSLTLSICVLSLLLQALSLSLLLYFSRSLCLRPWLRPRLRFGFGLVRPERLCDRCFPWQRQWRSFVSCCRFILELSAAAAGIAKNPSVRRALRVPPKTSKTEPKRITNRTAT